VHGNWGLGGVKLQCALFYIRVSCALLIAGCIASQMGLPVRLVVAVNSNDIVARLINTGTYSITGPIIPSLASAMDIQVTCVNAIAVKPSNICHSFS